MNWPDRIDATVDDLNGLIDYLGDVEPEDMRPAELSDWRRRLDAARDCLAEIEDHYGEDRGDDEGVD